MHYSFLHTYVCFSRRWLQINAIAIKRSTDLNNIKRTVLLHKWIFNLRLLYQCVMVMAIGSVVHWIYLQGIVFPLIDVPNVQFTICFSHCVTSHALILIFLNFCFWIFLFLILSLRSCKDYLSPSINQSILQVFLLLLFYCFCFNFILWCSCKISMLWLFHKCGALLMKRLK